MADILSENLQALRAARGWSQTYTAQVAEVTQTAISSLERGVTVRDRKRVVQRLADTFGVSVGQLSGETDDRHLPIANAGDFLPENLKALRASRGLSQTEAARHAGVAQTVLSRLERGDAKRPSSVVISRIASAFQVSVERLLGERIRPTVDLQPSASAHKVEPTTGHRPDPSPRTEGDPDAAIFDAVKELDLPLQVLDAARSVGRVLRTAAGVSVGRAEASELVGTVARLHREGKPLGDVSVLAALAWVALTAPRPDVA